MATGRQKAIAIDIHAEARGRHVTKLRDIETSEQTIQHGAHNVCVLALITNW